MASGTLSSSSGGELRALLGPLVSPLLRSPDGTLDLNKLPSKSFEEFHRFLITQVKIDGLVLNEHLLDSYHKVLAKEDYRPLLEELFSSASGPLTPAPLPQGGEGSQSSPLSPQSGERGRGEGRNAVLLKKFIGDLIDVSAENFVNAHIDHESGRSRLRSALLDGDHYKLEIRSDLAKAIAQVGYQKGTSWRSFERFNRKVPVMDYWNLTVNDRDLGAAFYIADEILDGVAEHEKQAAILRKNYLENPSAVQRFPGLERALGDKITDEQIKAKAQMGAAYHADLNPASQLKAKLADLWLMIVDGGHWEQSNAYKTGDHGAFILRRTEELLKQGEAVKGEAGLLQWSEAVRDFLNGGLKGDGFFASATVADMMTPIPQAHRAPYDELKQFVDEIHFASDMGEGISSKSFSGAARSDFEEVRSQFLHGLQRAKRQLWYGYKQHKGISRGISQVASWFNSGDIAEIKFGQKSLDQLMEQVQNAKDPSQLEAATQNLQNQLKEDGAIHQAMRAAEMEASEHILGLGQTILILLAGRGMVGLARHLTSGARAAKVVQERAVLQSALSMPVKTPSLGAMAKEGTVAAFKSFGLGSYISAAENVVAVATGEVRNGGENWESWLKDSTATGLSMALTAPFPLLGGRFNSGNILQDLKRRYWSDGFKAASGRLALDTAAEIPQEWLDAAIRTKMDDWNAVVGWDQARELGLISAFGGVKMGLVKELVKKTGPVTPSNDSSPGRNSDPDRPSLNVGPLQQMLNLAAAYGTQNTLIRQAPFLFPLTHPQRIRTQLEGSLRNSLLGPLEEIPKDGAAPLAKLWRHSTYRSLMMGIKFFYPVYWLVTRPFELAKSQENEANKKILEEFQKRREAFQAQAAPSETDFEAAERPENEFQAMVSWSHYQRMAAEKGWDPELTLARGLKNASPDEVDLILNDVFGSNLDSKIEFLSRYPLRGGVPILKRWVTKIAAMEHSIHGGSVMDAFFESLDVPQDTFDLYFHVAEAFESLGFKSKTSFDLKSQSGLHPQRLLDLSAPDRISDETRLRSLQTTLKFLQDRMAPEEVTVPGLDWFANPRLRASVIRLWGATGRKDFLPEVLAVLKNQKDSEVLQAAAWTLAHWGSREAVKPLTELAQNAKSILTRVAARRALAHIDGVTDVEAELEDWLVENSWTSFIKENEVIWREIGWRPFNLETGGNLELLGDEKFQRRRLEFAQALLNVAQDYQDEYHRTILKDYQTVAFRMLFDSLFDGTPQIRQDVLETLVHDPDQPLKRLLQIWGKDWYQPQEQKFLDLFQVMRGYIEEENHSLDSRAAILGLLARVASDQELDQLSTPFLADPKTAPAVARALDKNNIVWDEHIQKERTRLMTPGRVPPGITGAVSLLPPLFWILDKLGVESPAVQSALNFVGAEDVLNSAAFQSNLASFGPGSFNSPWQWAFGALVALGVWAGSGKGKGKRHQLRKKILANSKPFFKPISEETSKTFTENFVRAKEDPVFRDNYLIDQLATISGFAQRGFDPIFVLHNTGSNGYQFRELVTGEGKGNFPMTIRHRLAILPDIYRHSLERYALRRGEPHLTLAITLSASELLKWILDHREEFAAHGHLGAESVPAVLIPSLIHRARSHGTARVLALPSRSRLEHQKPGFIRKALRQAGLPEDIFIEAKGPNFEDVLNASDRDKFFATIKWARPLAGRTGTQMQDLTRAWIDLVWDYLKKEDPIALSEKYLITELEKVAAQENLVLPGSPVNNQILQEISQRVFARADQARKKMEVKIPKTNFPDHNLMKVMEVWKRGRGFPEKMIYSSFAQSMGVSLEAWVARMVKQGKEPEFGVVEAIHGLFGFSDDPLRPFNELDWITDYRVPHALIVVGKYLTHPDQKVRFAALDALMELNPVQAPQGLVEMLYEFIGVSEITLSDLREIERILLALRKMGIPPGSSPSLLKSYLLALMDSRIEDKRFKNSDPEGLRLYVPDEKSDDHKTRPVLSFEAEATFHALGFGHGKPFLELELKHRSAERRLHALEIVHGAQLKEFYPEVLRSLEDSYSPIRELAVQILGSWGGPGVEEAISLRLFKDRNDHVRIQAAESLLQLRDPKSAAAASLSLQNETEEFPGRVKLIELLGILKDRNSIPMLSSHLNSRNTRARLEAAAALVRMGEVDRAVDVFREFLLTGDRASRVIALRKMASLPTEEGYRLFRAVRDIDPHQFKKLLNEKIPEAMRLWDRYQKGWDQRIQANWDWMRTELKNGALISPAIKDPNWRKFLKDSLGKKESDLGAGYNLRFQHLLEEAAQKQWSQEEARIQLIEILQEDFLDALYELGGKRESQDLRTVIEKDLTRGIQVPLWVKGWLALNPSTRIPMAGITLSREELDQIDHPTTGNVSLSNSLELYETLAEQIAPLLGLPHNFLVEQEEGGVRILFLPIRFLLEGLDARFGKNAVKPVETTEISTLWDMVRMVKNGERPLLISRKIGDIEGRPQVMPLVRTLHEIYHLLTMSQLPENIQQGAHVIIEIMEEMGMIQEDDSSLGALLDGLLGDTDPGFGDIFYEMANYQLRDPVQIEIFYEKLKEKTQKHPDHTLILANFEKIYGEKLGMAYRDTIPSENSNDDD